MGSATRDNAFTYVNGALNWCDADVASIAQRTGTPSLVYSSARIRSNLETLRACAAATNRSMGIALALKAAGHASIVKSAMAAADAIAPCNLLCEVMSAEEYDLALALGFSPDQIVVNGLGWQRSLIEAIVAHHPSPLTSTTFRTARGFRSAPSTTAPSFPSGCASCRAMPRCSPAQTRRWAFPKHAP